MITIEEEIKKKEERRKRLANLSLDEKIKILIEIQKLAEIADEIGRKETIRKHWELEE